MVTYRRDQARRHWHRPWPVRVVLVGVGVVVVLVGLVGWSLEGEYGGDPDREEYVVGHDEATGLATVEGESGVVFQGTEAEVDAWLEEQRGSRNYLVPVLLIAGGSLAFLAGLAPSPRARTIDRTRPGMPVGA